ncbi:hypothetical protein CXF72_02430 [Psychromonas sp. MB-3u-54]|nr:hypothetical protein CXF72_02430 [Psychromonas sp. MB-3u-54]
MYCAGKINASKALVAGSSYSPFTKSYGTILNSFSWPRSGEGQDVLNTKSYGTILNSFSWPRSGEEQNVPNKTHNADSVNFNQQD